MFNESIKFSVELIWRFFAEGQGVSANSKQPAA
jgi:hypothetical protein